MPRASTAASGAALEAAHARAIENVRIEPHFHLVRRLGYWLLQDAKARFSELVRKVRSEGPQHVTVHGRDEVVVIAAEEFRRLKGSATGQALVEAMQAFPHRDIEIAPKRGAMPVRDVSL